MRSLSPVIAMLVLAASSAGQAQQITIPGDYCGQLAAATAKPLEGKWLVVNRDGGGTVGSMFVPISGRPTENLTLEHAGNGVLTFRGKDQRLDMAPQALGQHLPHEFNIQVAGKKIVSIDVSKLLPCAWEKMPGYVGTLNYPLPGVGEMQMKVILNFPNPTQGFGALHFTGSMQGRQINVFRHVTLTRR